MVDEHHVRAKQTGARIVHSCGYDSIPSDLGVLMLQEHAQKTYGARCPSVKFFAGESKGAFSGGTVASILNVVEEATRDPNVRRIMGDPYALDPGRERRGPDGADQVGVRWDSESKRWTAPFLMAGINTRIVRRSNALLGYAYGTDFRYSEAMSFGSGPGGLATAVAVTAAMGGFLVAVTAKPVRKLLERSVLPHRARGRRGRIARAASSRRGSTAPSWETRARGEAARHRQGDAGPGLRGDGKDDLGVGPVARPRRRRHPQGRRRAYACVVHGDAARGAAPEGGDDVRGERAMSAGRRVTRSGAARTPRRTAPSSR